MNPPTTRRPIFGPAVLWGLLAFALLAVRFSPNWADWYFTLREAKVGVSDPAQRAAIEKAIFSAYSTRGLYVLKQSRALGAEIDDERHQIVRWRLLVPAVGHTLHLPDAAILGLAHLGCLILVLTLAAIGAREALACGRPLYEAACLAVVTGASAPFFTSMGLLGYYDSWLVVGLIAVAFARARWAVALACLLAPWIDERFVFGLPLALGIRWILAGEKRTSFGTWARREAAIPLGLAGAYALFRLHLGGTHGSQTVHAYMRKWVLDQKVSPLRRLVGAWEGLRCGWFVAAAGVAALWWSRRRLALWLASGVVLTAGIGLVTALDLGRSMALIVPAVPLGWILATRATSPALPPHKIWTVVSMAGAPVLAIAALLLPARHVVGEFSRPVDNMWSPSEALVTAENGIGFAYGTGDGVPRDGARAVVWYRRAAVAGNAEAEFNLGGMYATGDGVPHDPAEAVVWYGRAADQGLARAEYNLGLCYVQGDGVPRDGAKAETFLRRAAEQGYMWASYDLGMMYDRGEGVAPDGPSASAWYRRAADQGYPDALVNLAAMYASGRGFAPDMVQAFRWLFVARARGSRKAEQGLSWAESALTPEQIAQATRLAAEDNSPSRPAN